MRVPAIALLGLLLLSGLAVAGEPAVSEERAELFIALLRRRAQRILEQYRAPPPPLWSGSAGVSEGYESNVALDGERRGDTFTEESFSLVLRPQFRPWLRGELAHSLLNSHFPELTDSDLFTNTSSAVLQIQPNRLLRLDLGGEYGLFNFPRDSDSSFADQRVKAQATVAQTSWLSHKGGWIFQLREYDTRNARDSSGADVAGLAREDRRHTGFYELQFRFTRWLARLGAEFYRNFSNEQSQEFYDWEDIRVRGSLTWIFNPRWLGVLSAMHERKNYQSRSVPAIAVAQRDNLLTLAGSLIVQLNPKVSLSFSLTYRYQDSNDPRLDFTDWVSQMGVTVSF